LNEIKGLDEIKKKLDLLPDRIGRNAMKRALRKGAKPIRDAARANAKQLDDPETSESIAKNITVQSANRRREKTEGGPVMRVGVLGGARDMRAHGEFKGAGKGNPGGDTFYWRFLEFGTSKMAAHPFMRPAMASAGGAAMDATVTAMQAEVDKELAKL
jgi:HK97 gp10 family phage protein